MATNTASFADRDENLFRLNIDLRMEQIRQNSAQYNFDHFQSILKRNLKEKKIVADTSDDLKTDLQKALNYLNEHDVEEEEDCRLLDNIKELSSLLRLSSVAKPDGFNLTGDSICIQVNTDGKAIESCFVSYVFDSKPKQSEITRRCLQQNQVEELACSLQKMSQLIPVDVHINGRQVDSSIVGQVLFLLEKDLMELKKQALSASQRNKSALEYCFARTEVYPFTFVLSADPFIKNMLHSSSANESLVLCGQVLYSAYLCLVKTDVLNSFPSKSFLSNNKEFAKKSEELTNSLPVEYCLRFSRPILLSCENFTLINDMEGVTSVKVVSQVNLFRHLSGCYQDFIKVNCKVSPEVLQQYEITDFPNLNSEDVVVSEIRFFHPKNLTALLQTLRVQLLHNSLFESLCHRPDDAGVAVRGKHSKLLVHCNLSSVNSSLFNLLLGVGQVAVPVKLSIANGLIKVDTSCDEAHSRFLPQLGSLCEDSLKSTYSIPLLVHLISTNIQDKLLQSGIVIDRKQQGGFKEDSEEEEENQFDNININPNSASLLRNSAGKTGQSWLFVDHKMTTTQQQTKHTNQKRRTHTFFVLKEQDSNSLLRSIKHVGLVQELIPVPSTLSHSNNNSNTFGLPRHLSSAAGHLARPAMSSSDGGMPRRSTETTQATLNYAFSDLEAIAEMGVADDAESVMSETHSNMSSSIMDCSPSATTTSGAQGDKANRQLSPIEQAKLSTLYRRRLMQQQQAGQQSNVQNSEVFDFRAENEHGMHMQSPNLVMPGNSSGNPGYDAANPQYMQFDPLGLSSPVPYTPSSSGRRRGRGRKAGNNGDRMPSMDVSELPESPSSMEYIMGQARKTRGASGTHTQRRARKPRKPSNVGSEQSYIVPYAGGERPVLQKSFSKQSANYVASPNEDMQMKLEMEFCYDYSSDEETDPPPPRILEPSASSSSTIRQKGVKTSSVTKPMTEEQGAPSSSTSEGGAKPPNLQQISQIASMSSNNSSCSTTASPSPQEGAQKQARNEASGGVQSAGKTIKMDVDTAAAPSPTNKETPLPLSNKAKPSATLVRKPSIQPTTKLIEQPKPIPTAPTNSSNSYLDLYDNELDSNSSSAVQKADPPKPVPSKEKVKIVVSSKPAKERSSTTPKEKDQSKRKSNKGHKSDETLKVVLKLPKASGKGEGAKYSSSSSPSSSSSSSVPAAPIYAPAAACNLAVNNSTEPIARLSSHAAPPSKSKLSIQSRYGVDVGAQQRQQPVKRKSSVDRNVDERKKKVRKEAVPVAGSANTPAIKSGSSSKDVSKTSKKSSSTALGATTTAAMGSEYSSLVNTPSKFMSLKNFRIPKVVESETATKVEAGAALEKPSSSAPAQDVPAAPAAKIPQATPQDQSYLQRRPSKSILKNSAPHSQMQQQMAPNYRGQAPQNRKALLPSPIDKRPSPRPSAPAPSTTNSFQQGSSWPVVGAQKVAASGFTPAKDWAFQPLTTPVPHIEQQQQQPEQDLSSLARQDNSPSEELRICDEEE